MTHKYLQMTVVNYNYMFVKSELSTFKSMEVKKLRKFR